MSIVTADGLDGLTMPRLAALADAAVGGLYRYFDGKAELVVGLQVRALTRFDQALSQYLAEVEDRPRSDVAAIQALVTLLTIADGWTRFADEHPALHALIDGSLSDPRPVLDGDHARVVGDATTSVLTRLAARFDGAVEVGALTPGDAMLRMHVLWAALHGLDHFAKRDRLSPPALHAHALRRELVDALLGGWGAASDSLARARSVGETGTSNRS